MWGSSQVVSRHILKRSQLQLKTQPFLCIGSTRQQIIQSLGIFLCLKIIIIGLPLALTSILIISSYQFTKLIQIVLLFNCFNTLMKKAGGERKSCCCYNKCKFISLLLSFCLAFHFLHVNTPSILKVHFHFPILTLPITFCHYFSYIFYKKHKHCRLCLWRVVQNQLQIILAFLWGTTPLSGCSRKHDKNLLFYQVYFIIPTLNLLTLPSKGTWQLVHYTNATWPHLSLQVPWQK